MTTGRGWASGQKERKSLFPSAGVVWRRWEEGGSLYRFVTTLGPGWEFIGTIESVATLIERVW